MAVVIDTKITAKLLNASQWSCIYDLVLSAASPACLKFTYRSLIGIPYILFDPLCTFARLHTHRLTKASQSQARIQKRAAANTFRHRYKENSYLDINCEFFFS
jgi:hypothetical protein